MGEPDGFTIQVQDSSDDTFRWDYEDCEGFLVEIGKDFGDRPSRQLIAFQTARTLTDPRYLRRRKSIPVRSILIF